MSERLPSDRPGASSLHGDRGELEVTVSTVRLEELFAAVRRHVRLVVGVVLATVAAAGVVAYVTGPAYRAVAVIRILDPRRANDRDAPVSRSGHVCHDPRGRHRSQ